MIYGELPKELEVVEVKCKEMMFYQYLPIKLVGEVQPNYEKRLSCFDKIVGSVCCNYIGDFGLDSYTDSYVYLTAKYLYQTKGHSFNRLGWHSDGFLTDDINYIWCDKNPTVFNNSQFNLTLDDVVSMKEMDEQALIENDVTYSENQILRLNQFNIHRVADVLEGGFRSFVKISISKDKYNLEGNSHNYELDYNWEMVERKESRNIPQVKL